MTNFLYEYNQTKMHISTAEGKYTQVTFKENKLQDKLQDVKKEVQDMYP